MHRDSIVISVYKYVLLSFLFVVGCSLDEMFIRQHDGAVELIRQPTMPASYHHDADDQLAEGLELTAQGHINRRISET